MEAATLQLAEHEHDHKELQLVLGCGGKRSRSTAAELEDGELVVSSTTVGQEQHNRSNKTHGAVEITAIKLRKLEGGMAIQVEMTRQPSEPTTTWIIFVDASYRFNGKVNWGSMAMSGGAFCRCNSSDSRLRQVADALGFSVLLLAQQRIPQDSTHAELGAVWAALKKLLWAVEEGLLGGGRHVVRLLCDCNTVTKAMSPMGARVESRFWPLLSEARSLVTKVMDYRIDAGVMWVPGHQTGNSFWKAGNDEAHRRSTAEHVNETVWLPALSPAAAAKSLGGTGDDDAVRALFALGKIIAQDPNHRPHLLIPSLLPPSFAVASAQALIKVPASVPVFRPTARKPPHKARQPRRFEHMPAPAYHRGAGNPRSMQRGPPPQQRQFKRSGMSAQHRQHQGNYGPRRR